MTATPDVVIIGDVVTDVVVRTAVAAASPRSDADARITIGDGGAAANVAAWLRMFDVAVGLVARVGDDDAGRAAVARLAAAGVDTAGVVAEPGATTGTVVALVDPAGERTMLTDRGANLRLAPGQLPSAWFRRGAHLHVSGYALFDPSGRRTAIAALARARAVGMTASVDPASWAPLGRLGAARFFAVTSTADLCLPNVDEARVLAGTGDAATAAVALGRRYGQAVVTRGADGAVWSDGATTVVRDAAARSVVDTTGAGDAFTAGYLAGWLSGADPAVALAGGLGAAARVVARPGARP